MFLSNQGRLVLAVSRKSGQATLRRSLRHLGTTSFSFEKHHSPQRNTGAFRSRADTGFRFFSSLPNEGEDKGDANQEDEPRLLYKAPMGGLVTRLKRISITSCLVSIIGLPLLVYIKNGTWPDAKQIGMGGFAFVSATGSTMALHFVFGPYVLDLYEIPVRNCANKANDSPAVDQAGQEFMFKATTRSILGMKNEVVFNPLTEVTRYQGARPFANFIAKEEFVMYCHPELLDEETRKKLLYPKDGTIANETEENEKGKMRRPIDEDDGFL